MFDGIGIKNLIKVMRDFFGGGSDISPANPLPVFDPKVFNIVNSFLVTKETGGTITTDGTEQDVYVNDAPQGVFEPDTVKIDFTNQTAAETVVVRLYTRHRAGGAYVKEDQKAFVGVQDPEERNIGLGPNRFGVRVTMERTAGGAFAYDWEALYRG